jgi:hypothetical protein
LGVLRILETISPRAAIAQADLQLTVKWTESDMTTVVISKRPVNAQTNLLGHGISRNAAIHVCEACSTTYRRAASAGCCKSATRLIESEIGKSVFQSYSRTG